MTIQPPMPSLSSPDPRLNDSYRSLGVLPVIALVFGLLSFIGLAHPAAWPIPGLAVATGLVALVRIWREPDVRIGASMATTGLVLGLFFLSWAPTTFMVDRWMVTQQAREFAEDWLTAVFAGQTGKAYQGTLPVRSRQPFGTALDEFYKQEPDERSDRDAYFDDDIAKFLADLRGTGYFEFERCLGVHFDTTFTLVSMRYFIYRKGTDEPVLHLQMDVIRESDKDGVYWTLVELADAADVDRLIRSRAGKR